MIQIFLQAMAAFALVALLIILLLFIVLGTALGASKRTWRDDYSDENSADFIKAGE